MTFFLGFVAGFIVGGLFVLFLLAMHEWMRAKHKPPMETKAFDGVTIHGAPSGGNFTVTWDDLGKPSKAKYVQD